MGSSIGFYCGAPDNDALQAFAASIGLHLLAPTIDKDPSLQPELGPFCFLSLVPKDQVHPYGNPPLRITDAKDPMLGLMRAYFKNPYLVAGHIQWSDDVRALATQTKPSFQALTRWIKNEWEQLPESSFYVGPEAKRLIGLGAKRVNTLPGQADVHVIKV